MRHPILNTVLHLNRKTLRHKDKKETVRGHVWMWELDYKESWMQKNWCFWTVVLEKTLERPLDCREIQPVNPKGDQSWVFIGRTDVEAETPILWPSDAKSWLIGKDPDARKDWEQEEKGTTEDEMVGWHRRLNGHGSGWTPGVGDGQEGLGCCSSWGWKESDMPEWLNWTEHYLWGSWGKNTRVDFHFLFWWTTFCHSFIELWKPFCPDKAVIHVIILVSILIVIFTLKPVGL